MNAGKKYLDQGDAENALAIYNEAVVLVPNDPDVHLNLANCYLLSDAGADAIREVDKVLSISNQENLINIEESIRHLVKSGKEAIFDAEP